MEGYNTYKSPSSPYSDETKDSEAEKKEKVYVASLNESSDSDLENSQIETFNNIIIKDDGFPYLNDHLLRIVTHWSGAPYKLEETGSRLNRIVKNKTVTYNSFFDYHYIVQYDTETNSCNIIKGYFSISDNYEDDENKLKYDAKVQKEETVIRNGKKIKTPYIAHRANHCSGQGETIGISALSMAGADESDEINGDYPMKRKQWITMAKISAKLCDKYNMPVSPNTIIGHWAAHSIHNIPQKQKWDPMRLPWVEDEYSSKYYFKHGNQFRIEVLKRKTSFNILTTMSLDSLIGYIPQERLIEDTYRDNTSMVNDNKVLSDLNTPNSYTKYKNPSKLAIKQRSGRQIFNHKKTFSLPDRISLSNELSKLEVVDLLFLENYMFEEDVISTQNFESIKNGIIKDYLCFIKAKFQDKIGIIKVHSKNKLSDFKFSGGKTKIENATNDDPTKSLYSRLDFSDIYLLINIPNFKSGIVKIS